MKYLVEGCKFIVSVIVTISDWLSMSKLYCLVVLFCICSEADASIGPGSVQCIAVVQLLAMHLLRHWDCGDLRNEVYDDRIPAGLIDMA